MKNRLVFITAAFCLTLPAQAQNDRSSSAIDVSQSVLFYRDVGRIRWNFANGQLFRTAVPHATVGPRILCTTEARAECEIQVSARELYKTKDQRAIELLSEVKPYLTDSVEESPQISSVGNPSVEYVTLTHKKDGGSIAVGHFVQGPFVIKFRFIARDPDGAALKRVLDLISSAEAINGAEFLSFKLADTKAACEALAPELQQQNGEAFGKSRFSNVDYVSYFVSEAAPSRSRSEVEANLRRIRQLWIQELSELPKESIARFCKSYPAQIEAAEN